MTDTQTTTEDATNDATEDGTAGADLSGLLTSIDEPASLAASIALPYTLTTGHAAGTFKAEMAKGRIVASKCRACDRVTVPPQENCPACGGDNAGFVALDGHGRVTASTQTDSGCYAFVRLDGADSDLLHRTTGEAALAIGTRVAARWRDELTSSITSIEAFEAVTDGAEHHRGDGEGPTGPAILTDVEAIAEEPYAIDLRYQHAYGPYYGRFFDELASRRRLLGSKCSQCHNVLVPPREICEVCYARTVEYVDVADTGRLQAFSVIHLEFVGQTRKPPYVYAEIVLDGSATRLIHTVGGFDVATAAERLWVGMPVRAVWRPAEESQGTLDDIDYFEPVFADEDAAPDE